MPRDVDKWCNRCGYASHKLHDIEVLSEYGICAECVLDLMRTDPPPEDVMQYIKEQA